VRGAVERTCSS